ncbi:unnamed protein product, partial [Meganyctiphanes norvegica]
QVLQDPVMLPACGHSLCRACLMGIKPQPPSCPICRKPHQGPPPEKLPTNYSVANLARTHHVDMPEVTRDEAATSPQQAPSAPLSLTPTSPLPSAPTSTLPLTSTSAPSSSHITDPSPTTAYAPSSALLDSPNTSLTPAPSSDSQSEIQSSLLTAPNSVSQTAPSPAPSRVSPSAPPLSEFSNSDMELIFAGLQASGPGEGYLDRPTSTDQLVPSQ